MQTKGNNIKWLLYFTSVYVFVSCDPHTPSLAPLFLSFTPRHLVSPVPLSSVSFLPLSPFFLFPLHSLMFGLSQQTDPCTDTGRAGLSHLPITGAEPMRREKLLSISLHSEKQEAGGGEKQQTVAWRQLFISFFLCVSVNVCTMCVCESN